jgi:hypothetical protein
MLSLLLAGAISAAPTPFLKPPGWQCRSTTSHHAAQRGKTRTPRKLNELPTANMYKSVYLRVDGCDVPVVARYGLGR